MAEDRNEWMKPDSEREVAVKHLVETTDLSPLQAKELVSRHGTDLDRLLEIARTMKAEG